MNNQRYSRFEDFWPYYVREHTNALNRKLHFWGTNNLFFWIAVAVLRRSPKLLIFAVVSSYAYAWLGHFFIQRNRPATLDYPLLSAVGDLTMYFKIWQGTMDAEVDKYTREQVSGALDGQSKESLTISATTSGTSQ